MLTDTALKELIYEHLHVFWTALIFSLLTGYAAWKNGFFKHSLTFYPPVKGNDVLKAFFYFLFIQLFIIPAVAQVMLTILRGEPQEKLDEMTQSWVHIFMIWGGFLGIISFFFSLTLHQRHLIWGHSKHWYKHFFLGAITWFIAYPFVLAFGQIIAIAVLYVFRQTPIDQVAVRQFRSVLSDPFLFYISAFTIIFIVPILEELLFRGFLQSWIKEKLKLPKVAIILTSIIFAFFHFSLSQGITNIELLFSLFMLSCFLGFLYEREQSLWAPIGLHSFFNGMSILMIIYDL